MHHKVRLAALAAFVALPLAVSAQEGRSVMFGVSAGLTMPIGHLGDVHSSGFNLTGHATLSPASLSNLSFRGDLSYDKFDAKENIALVSQKGSLSIIGVTANVIYAFTQDDPGAITRPYILGGAGFYNSRGEITTRLGEVEQTHKSSDTNLGMQFGGGMEFNLSSGFSAFAEAKLVNVFGESKSTRLVPISFGVRF